MEKQDQDLEQIFKQAITSIDVRYRVIDYCLDFNSYVLDLNICLN